MEEERSFSMEEFREKRREVIPTMVLKECDALYLVCNLLYMYVGTYYRYVGTGRCKVYPV